MHIKMTQDRKFMLQIALIINLKVITIKTMYKMEFIKYKILILKMVSFSKIKFFVSFLCIL